MLTRYATILVAVVSYMQTSDRVHAYPIARTEFHRCSRASSSLNGIPRDISFDAGQVEILRVLGKIDVQVDKDLLEEAKRDLEKSGDDDKLRAFNQWNPLANMGRATSVRVFEARIPGGTTCFLKEYLPVGMPFGRRELTTTRKLTAKWNELDPPAGERPPFPIMLGSLETDARIENLAFRARWSQRFPRTRPPDAGNLWLIFRWDSTAFKALRVFPPLPQVVEGLDYFRKDQRILKRWRFIRRIMRSSLEMIDFFHRHGYAHNAVSSESMWMTTTNQQEIDKLKIIITDMGACQRFVDLDPIARDCAMEDMYQLGFVFLELVLASYSDDNVGAQTARAKIAGDERNTGQVQVTPADLRNLSQLSQKEIQGMFEKYCDSDFQLFREFVRSIEQYKDAIDLLERDQGAAWKLIFKLLARGRLYDNDKEKLLKITGSRLLRDHKELFEDTYGQTDIAPP